jgi:hypothetical protein
VQTLELSASTYTCFVAYQPVAFRLHALRFFRLAPFQGTTLLCSSHRLVPCSTICCSYRSPPAPAASPCNAVISSGPTKTTVTGGYGCSVTVTVKSGATSGSGTLLAGAAVDVLWFHSYTTAIAGWDNTAGVLRTGTTLSGKTAGTVTISSPTMPKGKGGCRARVQSVRLTGYSLSAAVEKPTTWNS